MMKKAALSLLLLASLAPSNGDAYFDRLETGARAVAMAKTFHALADDPAAVYWNPAGLAWQRRAAVLLAHNRPYVVEDLSTNFAAFALPLPPAVGTAGVGWHRTSLANVVSEDLFFLSAGRRASIPVLGDLGIGITGKIFRVGYSDFRDFETSERVDYGSQTKLAADLGAIVRPHGDLRIGAIVRNVGEPRFDFVDGGGGTRMSAEVEGSITYLWNEASLVSAGFATNRRGDLSPAVGGEVLFFDVFALRSGLFDHEYWGGFGVLTGTWFFDAGFATHKTLGVSYTASITVPIGRER
ncbi:MAG: hypothetical protein FJY73_10685 [Candidatus Eisenbacteria bacterium]|nr:hypothetical protein [Candidatus Eisenbacteria bacterium]